MDIMTLLERVAGYAHERYAEEMRAVKEEYFRDLTIMHESDELYEEAMKAYLDIFLFEHPVDAEGRTVIDGFLADEGPALSEEEQTALRALAGAERALYQIRKTDELGVDLQNLMTGKKFHVLEDNISAFFKGDILEARVLPVLDIYRFGDHLRFHPKRAGRVIRKAAKAIGADNERAARALMRALALRKVKHYRFPRIDLLEFYKDVADTV
ncbi:MAG: hypothetical protein M5R36_21130 [Deltaproteobacteria bacterium]|nr:hypothetical protein [Deltaproteobacteria bacterium]